MVSPARGSRSNSATSSAMRSQNADACASEMRAWRMKPHSFDRELDHLGHGALHLKQHLLVTGRVLHALANELVDDLAHSVERVSVNQVAQRLDQAAGPSGSGRVQRKRVGDLARHDAGRSGERPTGGLQVQRPLPPGPSLARSGRRETFRALVRAIGVCVA